MKRVFNVMFADGEPASDSVGSVWPAKLSGPDLRSSFRTVAPVEGASTDIGLTGSDTMVGQCSSPRQDGPLRYPVGVAGFDIRPLKEITSAEKLSQRS